jgi:hypothetical protein
MNLRTLALVAAAAGIAAYLVRKERRGYHPVPKPFPEDRVIEQRIREKLAEIVADPDAIHVTVHNGTASLHGPVLPAERDRALTAVLDVPGVLQVTNLLELVEPAGSLPG